MPDGTSVGGVPSSLVQTMNADYGSTPAWVIAFMDATAIWNEVTNINFVQVSDNGEPEGAAGAQQGDPNVGDIRIGAIPMPCGQLAFTNLPPPNNGGTNAGDIFFNSQQVWGSQGYNLETVALHEIGHALGLGESAVQQAVMYTYYTGVKTTLNADDISAIQSLYGTPPTSASNGTFATATNLTPYINAAGGWVAIQNLDIPSACVGNYYSVTVPSNTTGTMTITMQVTGLSELSPRLTVFNANGVGLGQTMLNSLGTVNATYTLSNVQPGQVYYIRAGAATSGPGSAGAYGLEIMMGTTQLGLLAPPTTTVASQKDQGGGTENMLTMGGKPSRSGSEYTTTLTLDQHRQGQKTRSDEAHPLKTKVATLKRVGGVLKVRVVPQGPLQAFKTTR
jgi:hypothetical protein